MKTANMKKIILISFILSIVMYIMRINFYTEPTSSQCEIISIVETLFLTIALSLSVVVGVIVLQYKKIKTWSFLLFGLMLMVTFSFLNGFVEYKVKSMLASVKDSNIRTERALEDSNLTAKEKLEFRKRYNQQKESSKYQIKQIELSLEKFNKSKYYWIILLIISLTVGIFLKRKKKNAKFKKIQQKPTRTH